MVALLPVHTAGLCLLLLLYGGGPGVQAPQRWEGTGPIWCCPTADREAPAAPSPMPGCRLLWPHVSGTEKIAPCVRGVREGLPGCRGGAWIRASRGRPARELAAAVRVWAQCLGRTACTSADRPSGLAFSSHRGLASVGAAQRWEPLRWWDGFPGVGGALKPGYDCWVVCMGTTDPACDL